MLNIITQNTRGLKDKGKVDFLEKQFEAVEAQIAFIQEHMLKGEEKIKFTKYQTKQTNRGNNEPGGGTAISIHEKITENEKFKIKSINFDLKLLEATALELKYENYHNPLLLVSIYLSPNFNNYVQKITELKLNIKNYIFTHDLFIGGDFNAAIPKKNIKITKMWKELAKSWL